MPHRPLVERAIAERAPVSFREDRPAAGDEGLVLAGVRAALCAPVLARERVVACLYLTDARSPGRFGPEEERVAAFLARLAGAALETAEGYSDLRVAHDRMKELDELKTRFLNVAAHELFTPLTPIALQVRLLRSRAEAAGALPREQRASWDLLDRNVARLTQLVQDMLDVSRIQAGRFAVTREPMDLQEVVREAVHSFEEPARLAGLRLELGEGPALPIEGDAGRLTQVLFNLLGNAIKFTPRGGLVQVVAEDEDGRAAVRVTDSGPGLAREDQGKLFRPFVRLREDAEGRAGSGLGLYISRGIVDQHGGRIWAESPGPGQGSTFAFTVPLARSSWKSGADRARVPAARA